MLGSKTAPEAKPLGLGSLAVQCLVHLSVIFLCVGELPPGVNESHYLPKAKHVWDPSFASGGDIFLESHDSHLLASAAGGVAAWFLPLAGVAWVGRICSWTFLAFAWILLTRSLGIPVLLRPIALMAWFLASKYGHWAGEWAVGGFEAKSIAYPCALMALASLVRPEPERNWRNVWIWLGLSVAWHPVVGGWIGLTVGIYWLWQPDLGRRLKRDFVWLVLATLIGLVGVLPAASGIGGVDSAGIVAAPQVHVYLRLAHHMCPRTFALDRHLAAAVSLLALGAVSWGWARRSTGKEPTGVYQILFIAWAAVAISLVGLSIDLLLSGSRPYIASKLLRFYWFRWSDIAVPLAWTLTLFSLALGAAGNRSIERSVAPGEKRPQMQRVQLLLAGLCCSVLVLFFMHVSAVWQRNIPEADTLLVDVDATYDNDSERYLDWLAACDWIRRETPRDSLWFTPKYQQTFKWYAGRAEVVCWKDVPQDNASVLEWYQRINDCAPPRDSSGRIRDWTTDELLELSEKYGFEWVLLDRAFQDTPPLLEICYPIETENRSFAICKIPKR